MITLHDLETAIAKCQGEENPNAQTCIKLAAYYTIKDAMFGASAPAQDTQYSYDPGPQQNRETPRETVRETVTETTVAFDGDSAFAKVVQGLPAAQAWAVIDELMRVLSATNPRLHDGVLSELRKIQ